MASSDRTPQYMKYENLTLLEEKLVGKVHDQEGGSHQLHNMKVSSTWTLPNYFRFK